MLPHPDPEGFRQDGGLPQPKPQWGFGYAAEGAKASQHFARKPCPKRSPICNIFHFLNMQTGSPVIP